MSPVFRPRVSGGSRHHKEPYFPSIRAVMEEDHSRSSSIVLRPSHVFLVRHYHPYSHKNGQQCETEVDNESEDLDIVADGQLIYGINTTFLIPDWVFDANVNNSSVVFEQEPELPALPQRASILRTFIVKTQAIAQRLFLSKP